MTRILLVDNYDSFTYNLADGLRKEGAHVEVHRNDAVTRQDIERRRPDGIVLSPGPGHPENERDFGVCRQLIEDPLQVPMLGVCLGMQGMALHTGGRVLAAPELVHGESSLCELESHPLFDGLKSPQEVARYHSLCVSEPMPPGWEITARANGIIMAMHHQERPWIGVQFHPESILTPNGQTMLRNFIRMCEP